MDLFSQQADIKTTEEFDKNYAQLNPEQKIAVDHIEGPMMVIAGPGTGKTQILSVRIGNILRQQQIDPYNILCLTFTEAGSINMRQRLVKILGSAGNQVQVYTFHGFCNKIIKDNPQKFGGYTKQLNPISELEKVQIIKEIFRDLAFDHPLKKLKDNDQYLRKSFISLMSTLKQEGISLEILKARIAYQLEKYKDLPEFKYQRTTKDYNKGDLKINMWNDEKEKFDQTIAAAELLEEFNKRAFKNNLYDYEDMICWVEDAFHKDPDFLLNYQEQFQYILVDEYQDTNGIQNNILHALCSYDEKPNVFVVGDDDQAIYRFQGANALNMLDFKKRYDPELVVLKVNYRSGQEILDASKEIIEHTGVRLIHLLPNLTKELIAGGDNKIFEEKIQLKTYYSQLSELTDIIENINSIIAQPGFKKSEIAILYRTHRQISELIPLLEQHQIPYNLKRTINILDHILIHQFIQILKTITEFKNKSFDLNATLAKIIFYPFFKLSVLDAVQFAWQMRKLSQQQEEGLELSQQELWLRALRDEKTVLENPVPFEDLFKALIAWTTDFESMTVQQALQKVLTESGLLDFILKSPEKESLLDIFYSFFEFVKNESDKYQDYKLETLLKQLEDLNENDLQISATQIYSKEDAINLMTVHGAKGLEFEHVFLISTMDSVWKDVKRGHSFKLPSIAEETGAKDDDERRLFFVAMTRAKQHLYVSYYQFDTANKAISSSTYFKELEISAHQETHKDNAQADLIYAYAQQSLTYYKKEFQLISDDRFAEYITHFSLSPTALDKYLDCRTKFYFENVLRIPSARTASLGFGNAMHYCMDETFKHPKESFPNVEQSKQYFAQGMKKYHSHFTKAEYLNYIQHGNNCLDLLYPKRLAHWTRPDKTQTEVQFKNILHRDAPITGKIDKIEFYADRTVIVDYKTGNPKSAQSKMRGPDAKNPLGQNYWRQLVFYKILSDADPRFKPKMTHGALDLLEPDKDEIFNIKELYIEDDDIQLVSDSIVDTYNNIKNKIFLPGCGDADCYWCKFIQSGADTNAFIMHVEEPEE